jgi:spore coat protein A
MNRRDFFKRVAVAGGVYVLFRGKLYAFGQTGITLAKFQDSLPGLGPGGASKVLGNYIPITAATSLSIRMVQFQHQFHPGLPPTDVWGYQDITGAGQPAKYLGPVIVAMKGVPTDITFSSELPELHVLRMDAADPTKASGTKSVVDTTLMGAEPGQPENRTVPHLHGGFVPWQSDGGPYGWWTPDAPVNRSDGNDSTELGHDYGQDFVSRHIVYPNNMYSRLAWYHDHALGITRLNAYAGIAAGYVITDSIEQSFIAGKLLPDLGIPLVLQDKTFRADGSLWYPQVYEWNVDGSGLNPHGRWDLFPFVSPPPPPNSTALPLPAGPSCVPEYYSDTPVINGAAYPYVEVPATRVRFRMLNGSQARVYNLGIYPELGVTGEPDLSTTGGLPMVQIGTEGGFLPRAAILKHSPVNLNANGVPVTYGLLLGGAERADVLVDFSNKVGQRFILYNDAPAPFPGGDPRNDYFTGDVDQSLTGTGAGGAPSTLPGSGPNTRTLMEIRVVAAASVDPRSDAQFVADFNTQITKTMASTFVIPRSTYVRDLTLNEDFDAYGRLMQMLGTTTVLRNGIDGTPMFGRAFTDPTTEIVAANSTETWRIFNTTADTHPIHFHLANVKVISRAPFTYAILNNKMVPAIGPSRGPDANEAGWKETVRMNPGEVTTVQINFALPKTDFYGHTTAGTAPPNPRTTAAGKAYHTYVWHCHILEHEEHDMMRELWVGPVPLS